MKLSRKLQKLLSTDFFASAFEHLSRGTHPVNKRRILETLDRAQFEKLREQYPYRPGSPRINRFEDVVYWIEINIEPKMLGALDIDIGRVNNIFETVDPLRAWAIGILLPQLLELRVRK